jgi:hypothetical protein
MRLDPDIRKQSTVCDRLKPFNPALMRWYEVSNRVEDKRIKDQI